MCHAVITLIQYFSSKTSLYCAPEETDKTNFLLPALDSKVARYLKAEKLRRLTQGYKRCYGLHTLE